MKIHLIRYYEDARVTKSLVTVDGSRFCEAREPAQKPRPGQTTVSRTQHLAPGTYRCRCLPSLLSPMTLQVCRKAGQPRVIIGWHLLRQFQHGMISLGQADPAAPPEERELTRQQATFEALTARIYQAYARGETFELDITERFG